MLGRLGAGPHPARRPHRAGKTTIALKFPRLGAPGEPGCRVTWRRTRPAVGPGEGSGRTRNRRAALLYHSPVEAIADVGRSFGLIRERGVKRIVIEAGATWSRRARHAALHDTCNPCRSTSR